MLQFPSPCHHRQSSCTSLLLYAWGCGRAQHNGSGRADPEVLPDRAFWPPSQDDSCPEYMMKAEECLRQEEERVAKYLHVDSKPKLLKEVRMPRAARRAAFCVNVKLHVLRAVVSSAAGCA